MVSVSIGLVITVAVFFVVWLAAYMVLQGIGKTLLEGLLGIVPIIAGAAAAYYVYTWLVANAII